MKKTLLILAAAAVGLLILGGALYVSAAALGGNGTMAQIGNVRLIADREGFRMDTDHSTNSQSNYELSNPSEPSIHSENSQTLDIESSIPSDSGISNELQTNGWTTLEGNRGRLSIDTSKITGIDASLSISDLEISAGRSAYMEWEDKTHSTVSYQIIDGILTIREEKDEGLSINLFGDDDSSIKIYLPSDTAISLIVNSDLGDLELENLPITDLEYNGDLGDIDIENVSIDSITATAGTGDIQLENCSIGNAVLTPGMGDIEISGALTGSMSATSGMGDIKLKLSGATTDYAFDLSTDMGDIQVNNNYVQGTFVQKNDTAPQITAKTGMGDVEVEFKNK